MYRMNRWQELSGLYLQIEYRPTQKDSWAIVAVQEGLALTA
jgi:hypothetical protein